MKRFLLVVLAFLIGMLLFGGCVAVMADLASTPTGVSDQQNDIDETATSDGGSEVKKSDPGVGDGTWEVGTDIRPGKYKTSGPADSDVGWCYWERMKDLDSDFGSIIANGNADGPTVVRIKKGDAAFKTSGCSDWVRQ